VIEQSMAPAPKPREDWMAGVGEMNMARLAAEE
jgi:hypothetical protein